jgi:hypothetical protein
MLRQCRSYVAIACLRSASVSSAADPATARVDLRKIENNVAIAGAKALGELTGGPIALAFVLAADLLGVKLAVDRSLTQRVTTVRVGVRSEAAAS